MKVEQVIKQQDAGASQSWRPSSMRDMRRVVMLAVPALALLAVVLGYLLGGRYVSTDDAYVKADIVSISPEVSAKVTNVMVRENQAVTKGQPLVELDTTEYKIGLAVATAEIRTAASDIEADRASLQQKQQSLQMAETDATFANREYKRQVALGAGKFVAVSKLDEAQHAYESAVQKIALLKHEQAEILARLEGDPNLPLEQYPKYQAGLAKQAAAEYFITHAVITAPFDGVVSRVPKLGDFARTGAPLMAVVSSQVLWVDANYKETELTHIRPGQAVDVRVDTYSGHKFKGHVDSIAQATGGEFALLPAQNSTGNWVKVVQRIPVRIVIDEKADAPVLRAGMSVNTEVDTGARRISRWFGAE